jgi:hypothetical protein
VDLQIGEDPAKWSIPGRWRRKWQYSHAFHGHSSWELLSGQDFGDLTTPEALKAIKKLRDRAVAANQIDRLPAFTDPDATNGGIDPDEFYDPDSETAGKTYTRFGGFLDSVDEFDPEFFGISPREAVWIEPQQRLMLETVWEGLERAGYAPAALRGSRTGIFAGVAANEYAHLLSSESIDKIEPYFITGNALNSDSL